MATLRRILVPVDLTTGSLAALRHARGLATVFGSHIHLLHVAAGTAALAFVVEPFGREVGPAADARLEALDRLAALVVGERMDPFTTTGLVRTGCVEDVIAGYAEETHADLIVMGVHGDHRSPKSVGRVIERVMAWVHRPVQAVPEDRAAIAVVPREMPEEVAC
jgi:nucleotide-binding universal stress UspA family protein